MQTKTKVGGIALIIGAVLNVIRTAPIYLNEQVSFSTLPPSNLADTVLVAQVPGWIPSHILALLSVPLLIYGFFTIYQSLSVSNNEVVERVTLAGFIGLSLGLILYAVAAVIDGIVLPQVVSHYVNVGPEEQGAAGLMVTIIHETAGSFGGLFMATVLMSSGLLALGLYLDNQPAWHSRLGVWLAILSLIGYLFGIINLQLGTNFLLLGMLLMMTLIWWTTLGVRTYRGLGRQPVGQPQPASQM